MWVSVRARWVLATVMSVLLAPVTMSAASPASAVASLTVTPAGAIGPVAVGATPTASFVIAPNPGGASVHLEWTVRDGVAQTDAVVRSGGADVTPDVDGVVSLTFQTPTELGEGTFGLEVVASDDVPGTGPATGTSGILPLVVDNPAVVGVTSGQDVVYPAQDGFRDSIAYTLTSSEAVDVVASVVDGADQVVRTYAPATVDAGTPRQLSWNGRSSGGSVLPAGVYSIVAEATDSAGNVSTASVTTRLSLAKLTKITTTKTYPAARTMVDKFVGRCSTLVTPSSHGWKNSQGYYSQSRCSRTANNAALVIGMHGVYLPRAFKDRYGELSVSAYGGKAKRQRWAYLILGYYRASDDAFVNRVQLTPNLSWHPGKTVPADPLRYVNTTTGQSAVFWSTGLTEGSKYDVKSFKLKVERTVLRNPNGSLEWPARTAGLFSAAKVAVARPPASALSPSLFAR